MPDKPRPKPFPKLPAETPEQRKALAAIGPAQIEAAKVAVAGFKYTLHPKTGKRVKDAGAVAMLRAMLEAEG